VDPVLRTQATPETAASARRIVRLSRTAALGTLQREGGFPLTTLVGVATDDDGAPLLFLSGLAEHARNLAADERASLLFAPPPDKGDPLNSARITLLGRLRSADTPRRRERYAAHNPKSKITFGLPDFRIHRLSVEAIHYNGGFGRADLLTPGDLVLATDVGWAAAAEAELLAEAATLPEAQLAAAAGVAGPARPVGADPFGLDLAAQGEAARIDWIEPALNPTDWRSRLSRRLLDVG
jgi:heme iron utilization protein